MISIWVLLSELVGLQLKSVESILYILELSVSKEFSSYVVKHISEDLVLYVEKSFSCYSDKTSLSFIILSAISK